MSIEIQIGEINFSFPKEGRYRTFISDDQIRELIIAKLTEIADTVKNAKIEISDFGDFTRLFFDQYRVNAWDAFVFRENHDCGDENCYDPECTNDHD
jgi:hypothetical protein